MGGIDYDKALHDALPRIKARTLIVMGTRDTVAPVITAHRLKAGIANSHLSFIYGAAHALEFDAPARVAPLVAGFLERGEAFVVRGVLRRETGRLFNIKGHVAFVTGAASGLGLAYAEVMAENGAKVVLADIERGGTRGGPRAAEGGGMRRRAADRRHRRRPRHWAPRSSGTVARHGRLDIVFANAGGSAGPGFELTPDGSIDEADLATFDRWMAINFRANYPDDPFRGDAR